MKDILTLFEMGRKSPFSMALSMRLSILLKLRVGGKISDADTDNLIAEAQEIITLLGG